MGDFNYQLIERDKKMIGAHSITFTCSGGTKVNTWDTFAMAPKSRPFVAAPQVKTEYVDVPGADGALDYTEVLTGKPRYANRTGQWDFIIDNTSKPWYNRYSDILAVLHGQYFDEIVLEDDPSYKWKGRIVVVGQFGNKDYSSVSLQYNLDPYKRPVGSIEVKNWLWNELFGVSIEYGTFNVNGYKVHNVKTNTGMYEMATVTCSAPMKVYRLESEKDIATAYENNYSGFPVQWLTAGDNTFELYSGDNYLFFVGNGSVKFNYERGAML